MKLLITGATGLTGGILLEKIAAAAPNSPIDCLVRPTSDLDHLETLDLDLTYHQGDTSTGETWDNLLEEHQPETIIHIATVRHIETILDSLKRVGQTPRLIIVGSTGIYSQYGEYSTIYKQMEESLKGYPGSYCLLRPTMIYGSYRDKNIHKLIKFCDRYGSFFVFGKGNCLLQPVHTEDLADALFKVWQNPHVAGTYDLSGGSVVTFRELLNLVSQGLNKRVIPLSFPLQLGVFAAGILENTLKQRSPIRKEQILRLQEDKAYPNEQAKQDFGFEPRSFEVGLLQEIQLMKEKGLIK